MIPAKDGGYIRKTRDGETLTTKEMTTSHIKNCINYVKKYGMRYHGIIDYDSDRHTEFYDGPDKERDNEIINILEEELRIRGEL